MRLIEDQTCRGGYALRMGDNSGNDEIWLNWFSTLPIDDNKMYRIKYRYRRVSGAGVVYVGPPVLMPQNLHLLQIRIT